MKKTLLSLLGISSLLCMGLHQGQAETLALYDFGTSGPFTPSFASTDANADSTASVLSLGSGLSTSSIVESNVNFPSLNQPALYSTNAQINFVNETGATANDEFYSFSLDGGVNDVDLNSLTFDYAGTGGGAPGNVTFFVRSSVDSFASTIGSATTVPLMNAFNNANIDLSGASFQNLSSPIEFRIYLFDGGGVSTAVGGFIDNVTLDGTVTAVPEPSTYALLIGGLATLAFLRRNSKKK